MTVENLIKSGVNVNINLTPSELIEVIDYVIQKTKVEFEKELIRKNLEVYLTSKEVCDLLSIDNSTLWRWERRGYLKPIYVGRKKRYKKSEIEGRFTSMNN